MNIKRIVSAGLTLALSATCAYAVEVPLTQAYGNADGCRIANGESARGSNIVLFTSNMVRFGSDLCPVTGMTAMDDSADTSAWIVDIVCEHGHEEEIPGTLAVTEDAANDVLLVELRAGDGPEGEIGACSTQ